jgi:hypothetical protein
MKVGDLVKCVGRKGPPAWTERVGLIMEIDPDDYDAQTDFNTCFIQWMGDADWTFLYEDDFEVISGDR